MTTEKMKAKQRAVYDPQGRVEGLVRCEYDVRDPEVEGADAYYQKLSKWANPYGMHCVEGDAWAKGWDAAANSFIER